MDRRHFIKASLGNVTAIVVGSQMPWLLTNKAFAAVQRLNITITDALKDMVTNNEINTAQCYFWAYKTNIPDLPADSPGPLIFATQGDTITISITNSLDEPHAFFIPGMFDSGPIAPGKTVVKTFVATKTGTFLYYDNLNAPVNRVMGLHGAFIVMPKVPLPGHKFTPYDSPTLSVQRLFDDLGTSPWFPGLSWEQGDPVTDTPAFRQNIWISHQASPVLFAEVGSLPPGVLFDPVKFVNAFLHDPFSPDPDNSRIPQYFTINGQSGHFSHNNPYITPFQRVGEPTVIRLLNAGLFTLSNHIHGNHVYLLSLNNVVQANAVWIDTLTQKPLDVYDWLIPYMRPPDVPNTGGVGRGGSGDPALVSIANPEIPGSVPHPVWPPTEELNSFIPSPAQARPGETNLNGVPTFTAKDQFGNTIDLAVQLSPLCYPMHDHSEPTQTAQGGNYLMGSAAGLFITGDRNTAQGVVDFPDRPMIRGPGPTGIFPPTIPFNTDMPMAQVRARSSKQKRRK